MPHFHEFEWEGFNVSGKAKGARRCLFLRWLPYFSGNEPALKVSIMNERPEEGRSLEAHVSLRVNAGTETRRWSFFVDPKKPFISTVEDITLYPLSTGGDHSLKIFLVLPNAKPPVSGDMRDLVTFRVIVQETVTLLVVGAMLTLFGGVMGGLIVHWLSGG